MTTDNATAATTDAAAATATDAAAAATTAATTATDAAATATAATTAATAAAADDTKILGADAPKPLDQVIAEKYRVKKDDGTVDIDASVRKSEEARAALEAKLGSGDVRPKTAAEYKLELPPELKPLADTLPAEGIKAFQEKCFGAGLSQSQYDFIMREYLTVAPTLVTAARNIDVKAAVSELKATWPVEADYNTNVERANAAIRGYAGDDAAGIFKDYGADPRIVRMMAKIGAEMGEDRAPNMAQPSAGPIDIQALLRSEAYTNAKHQDHARVSQQVRDYYQRNDKKAA